MIKECEYRNHTEWLAIRQNYIGGSDAGAVIGMNPYKSPYTLWAEKTGKIPGFEGNLTTKVGTYLEQLVADLFEEETGKKCRKKNRTLVNDAYPFACANVDRLIVGEKALLEIKTTNSLPMMKQLRGSEFPDAYYAQVVHYLAVTELEKAYLAVLINCRELKIYELERDQKEIDALMQAEAKFWTLVKNDTPPEVDGAESTSETIKTLYPESNGFSVDLMPLGTVLSDYADLKAQVAVLEGELDSKANLIKDYMKDAERGEYGRYKVSYGTRAGRETFDKKKLEKEHPEINMANYTKVGNPYRVFSISIKEDK